VHANEVALNQFHASLKRRVLLMDTEFLAELDILMWLREYILSRFPQDSSLLALKLKPVAETFSPLLLALKLYQMNSPRKLKKLLEDPMRPVTKEPLITIGKTVVNIEGNPIHDQVPLKCYRMWPLLKLCLNYCPLEGKTGEEELNEKTFVLLNQMCLSQVTTKRWNIDPERLFFNHEALVAIVREWCEKPQWSRELERLGQTRAYGKTIIPGIVELHWEALTRETFARKTFESIWSESDINQAYFALALLRISVYPRSSFRSDDILSDTSIWFWPATISASLPTELTQRLDGCIFTAFIMYNGGWRRHIISTARAQFARVNVPRDFQKCLNDFITSDEDRIDWMPGDVEYLNFYNNILSGFDDGYNEEADEEDDEEELVFSLLPQTSLDNSNIHFGLD
jgi:hypothetical protein